MKINKGNKTIVLTIVVLGNLVSNVKNVGALPMEEVETPMLNIPLNIDNKTEVSLTDYQLEADIMWDNYVEIRKQLILLELEYPQYVEYVLVENSIPAGLYQVKAGTFDTEEGAAIAEEAANLIEWAEFYRSSSINLSTKTSLTRG